MLLAVNPLMGIRQDAPMRLTRIALLTLFPLDLLAVLTDALWVEPARVAVVRQDWRSVRNLTKRNWRLPTDTSGWYRSSAKGRSPNQVDEKYPPSSIRL